MYFFHGISSNAIENEKNGSMNSKCTMQSMHTNNNKCDYRRHDLLINLISYSFHFTFPRIIWTVSIRKKNLLKVYPLVYKSKQHISTFLSYFDLEKWTQKHFDISKIRGDRITMSMNSIIWEPKNDESLLYSILSYFSSHSKHPLIHRSKSINCSQLLFMPIECLPSYLSIGINVIINRQINILRM